MFLLVACWLPAGILSRPSLADPSAGPIAGAKVIQAAGLWQAPGGRIEPQRVRPQNTPGGNLDGWEPGLLGGSAPAHQPKLVTDRTTVGLEFLRVWQFLQRAALQPRAPDLS